jgi:predicted MPP superfamily phosphohydrolase
MRRRLFLGAILLALLGLADACWYEPRRLLLLDSFRLPLNTAPMRIVQLSDLHISEETALLRRLLGQVEAAQPDLILISGDLIRDVPAPGPMRQHLADTAAYVAALRRIAPVIAVQGHSEFQGPVVARLQEAGLRWLSNEGTAIGMGPDGAGRGFLLLGVNQQVGVDDQGWAWPSPFRPVEVDGRRLYGATRGEPYRNFYSHYDPDPNGLADAGGPLAWSGYEMLCDVRIDDRDTGAGIEVHSRYSLGEDRMIRLRRVKAEHGGSGSFNLVVHGSGWTSGQLDTGVDPQPGRWYRIRLRTEIQPGAVRVAARVWPAASPEPRAWQAWAEDRSPERVESGTVGLWAWGGGTVAYRDVRVTGPRGRVLLEEPLTLRPGDRLPAGWREGARGTRLALALARSPRVPAGTPRIVLSHTPDVVLEASKRGIEAVLAGHTHGGQVRLPWFGALTTRCRLGAHYDFGRFHFASLSPRGVTTLYINGGIGTSVMPIRFWCPPRYAVIELGR